MSKKFEELVLEKLNSIDENLNRLGQRMDKLELRMDKLEQRMTDLEIRVNKLEEKIDKLEQHIGIIEERLLLIEQRIGRIEQRVDVLEVTVVSIDNCLTTIEKNTVDLDNRIAKKINNSTGIIVSELLGLKELQEVAQDLYDSYGTRITKNENQIEVLSAFVGYSAENVTVVAKDADNLPKPKPSFSKRSKPFDREEFIRKFEMLD